LMMSMLPWYDAKSNAVNYSSVGWSAHYVNS
jgi:hypothetical protein